MYFTRLATLVQFGSSWEMSSVKDSLTMECTVKYVQALTGKSSFWLINLVICANFQIMIFFCFFCSHSGHIPDANVENG